MKRWIALAVLAGLVWMTGSWPALELPLLFSLTPLQRYYLPAYIDSSWHKDTPFAETTVAWVWKGGAKRKDRIAVEEDVEPQYFFNRMDSATLLPLRPSAEAAAGGWTTLTNAYPLAQDSAQVESDLRGIVYDGASLGRVLLLPASTYLCAVLAFWLIRVWRFLDEHGAPRGMWLIQPWWVRLAIALYGAGAAITRAIGAAAVFVWDQASKVPWRRLWKKRETEPRPVLAPVLAAAVATAAPRTPKPVLPPLTVSSAPGPPQVAVPAVLPMAAAAQKKAAFVWDESKGLD